jgi:putative SOS response-associated peptidase YedK
MCGRIVTPSLAALARQFPGIPNNWEALPQRFNVGPTMPVPMVYRPDEVGSVGDIARWGLIPSWWNKETLPNLTFNARSEEAATKPMWRHGMKAARCLMPVQGWYEWNENEPVITTKGRKTHQPYYFHKPDEPVLAIAGLWSVWLAPDGADVLSCALLTREAEGEIASIHHRMPVVLGQDQYGAWLSPNATSKDVADLIAGSRHDFEAYPVSTRVNRVQNDDPQLLDRI